MRPPGAVVAVSRFANAGVSNSRRMQWSEASLAQVKVATDVQWARLRWSLLLFAAAMHIGLV
jgi:beta-N-acetylglucosaminidase